MNLFQLQSIVLFLDIGCLFVEMGDNLELVFDHFVQLPLGVFCLFIFVLQFLGILIQQCIFGL